MSNTTILDVDLLPPLPGGTQHHHLHFAIDGCHTASGALNQIAPGALYDQLGRRADEGGDRTIRELITESLGGGWVALPSATRFSYGRPIPSCAAAIRV